MDIRCEPRLRHGALRSALSAHARADSGARVHARRRKFFGKPSGGREQAAAPAADAGAAAPGAHTGEASALCVMRARKRVCLALMRGCAQADGTAASPRAEVAPAPKREPAHSGARMHVCVFACALTCAHASLAAAAAQRRVRRLLMSLARAASARAARRPRRPRSALL
jgi:hypothetical protein